MLELSAAANDGHGLSHMLHALIEGDLDSSDHEVAQIEAVDEDGQHIDSSREQDANDGQDSQQPVNRHGEDYDVVNTSAFALVPTEPLGDGHDLEHIAEPVPAIASITAIQMESHVSGTLSRGNEGLGVGAGLDQAHKDDQVELLDFDEDDEGLVSEADEIQHEEADPSSETVTLAGDTHDGAIIGHGPEGSHEQELTDEEYVEDYNHGVTEDDPFASYEEDEDRIEFPLDDDETAEQQLEVESGTEGEHEHSGNPGAELASEDFELAPDVEDSQDAQDLAEPAPVPEPRSRKRSRGSSSEYQEEIDGSSKKVRA